MESRDSPRLPPEFSVLIVHLHLGGMEEILTYKKCNLGVLSMLPILLNIKASGSSECLLGSSGWKIPNASNNCEITRNQHFSVSRHFKVLLQKLSTISMLTPNRLKGKKRVSYKHQYIAF
jgi:hypothetical protein